MRKTCLNAVHTMARTDERIIFVGSDLGAGTLDDFRREIPERFIMEGISEQHLVGFAAGLAMEGAIVYINTIGVFLTRRCFEQVCLDLCLHNLNVRLIGNGGGLVYAPLGPTHLAVDDMAIMRTLPNMTIIAPCDAQEMERLMPLTRERQGPIYIRLAKGGDRIVSDPAAKLEIGEPVDMRAGSDALLITTGVMTQVALDAAALLESEGVDVAVTHLHTVKPISAEKLRSRMEGCRALLTIEEGTIIGGLGGAVAEIIAEWDIPTPPRFRRMGLRDAFSEHYGSQAELLQEAGLTAHNVATTLRSLLAPPEHS